MRRLMNFSLGFIVGGILSAVMVLLITPQSAEAIRQLFTEAYNKKKADIEAELGLDTEEY